MKKIFIIALCALSAAVNGYSQSDGCSAATSLTVTANCSSPVNGTTVGATQTIAGCVGNADDDVWYKFTATSTSHIITVDGSAGFDAVVQLFSGVCSSLISLSCMDQGFDGDAETIYASGLTIGTVYTIRVYHYYAGSGSGTFTICVTPGPVAPANDNCASATLLNVNTTCSYTSSTSMGATLSQAGCAGTADDDVWFKFVASNSVQTITVDPSASMDAVLELFSGTCASLTSLYCMDLGFTDGNEQIDAVGLVAGNTYYVRVYDYYSSTGGAPFQICIVGAATAAPVNDDPCNSIEMPTVTSECDYLFFTTVGATNTTGVPSPTNCENWDTTHYGTPNVGGFSVSTKDVWFKIIVPSTGSICIMPMPGYGFTDGAMALYTGTCSSMTLIACSDDHNYPGTSWDLQPYIYQTGLTPGSSVYLRYWKWGTGTGIFGICVSTPTNDNCSNNLYICDLNNYSGTTTAAYTIDRPCNMRGNAEVDVTYAYTPGTCQGGIFGLGGAWGTGAPACDVQINNNSWVKFTASNTTATLTVDIYDCFKGGYPLGGIQMQMFSASSACCGFTPASDFKEGSSQLSITANNLTIGQDYYLMIDGFAGDICGYSISATGGVQFTDITTASTSICIGETITLYGPVGASSYYWYPGGQTTQNITVTPAYSQTYDLEVAGVCGDRQYMDITITVNNPPTATAGSNSPVCAGQSINLTSSGGSTYSWTGPGGFTATTQNPSRTNATTAMTGTYYVTVTSAAGCTSTNSVSVTVNSTPTATAGNGGPYCVGQTISLSSSGGTLYNWTGPNSWTGSGSTPTISSATTSMSGTYYVTVTNSSNCTATNSTVVTVNSNPVPNATNTGPYCEGQTISLTASGGTSYSWSGPGSWTSTGASPTRPGASASTAGLYTVTVTGTGNCTAATTTTVTLYNNPTPSALNTGPYCPGETIELSATGGTGYSWTGPLSFSSSVPDPTRPSATTSMAGVYTVTVTSSDGCTATTTTTVVVNNNPVADAGPDASIPNGTSTGLTANASGGSGSYSYSWSPAGQLQNASIYNPQTVNLSTSTTFTVTVTDIPTGCTGTDQVVITVTGGPLSVSVSANPGTICSGQAVQLTAQGSGGAGTYTYVWSSSPAGFSSTIYNPIVYPTVTTTYYVTVSDGSNTTTGSTTVTVNSNPSATAGNGGPYCIGSTIQLNSSGGTSYSWFGPDGWTSSSQSPNRPGSTSVMAGTYTVTVTNSNGCTATATTTVVLNNNPIAFASNDGPYCVGATIELSATGGNTYNWSGPGGWSSTQPDPTRANATLAMAGLYSVTVVDGNSCTATYSTTVSVNANPNVDAGNNASIPFGTTTILSSSVTGGSGNYTYIWSPSASLDNSDVPNPQTISLTVTTTFTVTVTDVNTGCTSSDNVTVTVTGGPLTLSVDATPTQICVGETVQLMANISGGTGSYQYTWASNPSGFTSSLQNPSDNPASTTTYTVTVSDGFNTTSSGTTVVVNPLPVAAASNTGPYCADGVTSISLSSSGGTQYAWSGPGGYTSSQPGPVITPATITTAGTYTVTVTNTYGCTATATTLVEVSDLPLAQAGTNSQYCYGDTIELFASGGVSYEWEGPGSFSSIEQNPGIFPADSLNSGIYIVTVTGNGGCSDTASVTVYYPGNMNISGIVTIDDATNTGMINITVTGGTSPYEFIWSDGSTIEDLQSLFSGTYVVTVTSSDLCSRSQSFEVDLPLIIPNVITPNDDGKNDDFEIINIGAYEEVKIEIFNRWGDPVFKFSGTGMRYFQKENRWNGESNGRPLPMGSYLYIISLDDMDSVTGSVLVKY